MDASFPPPSTTAPVDEVGGLGGSVGGVGSGVASLGTLPEDQTSEDHGGGGGRGYRRVYQDWRPSVEKTDVVGAMEAIEGGWLACCPSIFQRIGI